MKISFLNNQPWIVEENYFSIASDFPIISKIDLFVQNQKHTSA